MDHCLKDLSHEQGDPHDQEVSAHDAGGVNGTRSPRHAAVWMCCPTGIQEVTSLKSRLTFPPKRLKKKKKHEEEGDATGKRPTADTASLQQQQQRFKLLSPRQWREGGKKYERFPENTISDK